MKSSLWILADFMGLKVRVSGVFIPGPFFSPPGVKYLNRREKI
jgi:hypothetical protein